MITVPEEAERFRIQAEKDWETLLLARAKEMASGKYKNTNPILTNLVPRAFPFHPFFLREKPWDEVAFSRLRIFLKTEIFFPVLLSVHT